MAITLFPHLNQRVLHAPKTCIHCDAHPHWQELRQAWGIAFTGEIPDPESNILICPADYISDNSDRGNGNRKVPKRSVA